MERYIKSFENQALIEDAVNAGELLKPYVAYIEDEDRIDFNSIEKEDPGLLGVPFTIEALGNGNFSWDLGTIDTINYSTNSGEYGIYTKNSTISVNTGDILQFKGKNNGGYGKITTTFKFNAKGNIMSLVDSDNFVDLKEIPANNYFKQLFYTSKIVSAEELLLPATILKEYSYYSMFEQSSLEKAPELPATELVYGCYMSMFIKCDSLEIAPVLPAKNVANRPYSSMFTNCSKLKYIKCLAEEGISDIGSMPFYSVASTGTFVKKKGIEWPTGVKGIPTGWTVEEVD